MQLLWFIPLHGDGHYLGTSTGGRQVTFPYLRQIAEAADQLGYGGVLLPTGRSCHDAWVAASMLAARTERLKFLVALRPGLMSPAVAARMAAEIRAASPCHYLLQMQIGDLPPAIAMNTIKAWESAIRPRLEREFGPLDRIGVPVQAAA